MFKDVGGKIQGIAIGLFIVEVCCLILAGIGFIMDKQTFTGILIMTAGPLSAYFVTLLVVGFGVLVENSEDNNGLLCDIVNRDRKKHTKNVSGNEDKENVEIKEVHVAYCRNCRRAVDTSLHGGMCPWCGGRV